MEWGWLFGRCVAPPIQEMRLDVAWTALSLLNVCAVWPCVYYGMGYGLPVAMRHLTELVSLRHWVFPTQGH